jgi:hypothetical protein
MTQHRTYRGAEFNMAAFADQNGHVKALGNSNRNARGDVLDNKGNVIATAQEVNAIYNNKNPKAVAKVSITKDTSDRLTGQMPKNANPVAPVAKPRTSKPAVVQDPSEVIVSQKTIRLNSGEEKTEITYADGSVEIV